MQKELEMLLATLLYPLCYLEQFAGLSFLTGDLSIVTAYLKSYRKS